MTRIRIADLLPTDGSWPVPPWAVVFDRVAALPPPDRPAGWADATRQWLTATQRVLGDNFAVTESDSFQLLSLRGSEFTEFLLAHARYCRESLLDMLPDIARFDPPGKEVILALPDPELYYSYLSAYSPDDREYGGSAGFHVRVGYPHTVVCGVMPHNLSATLAHELTHAALYHLNSPQWLEEGITQLVTRAAVGHGAFHLTTEVARAHSRYWPRRGLGSFWWGHGFHAPGTLQRCCYELAEVLLTLLIEEHQPGWLGIGKGKRDRLLGFLTAARADDAGQAAAAEHLRFTLGALAAKFLGPGDWEPKPAEKDVLARPDGE